jgi:hypothetical protein
MLSGIALRGGFPGQSGQENDASARNPDVYVTTLSVTWPGTTANIREQRREQLPRGHGQGRGIHSRS